MGANADVDVRCTLGRTALVDGGGDGPLDGVYLLTGAAHVQIGVRPAPEWRSQLGLAHAAADDDAAEQPASASGCDEDVFDTSMVALSELTAAVPSSDDAPGDRGCVDASGSGAPAALAPTDAASAEKELASLPPAAVHVSLEMRPDGAQPTAVEVAFGTDAAQLHIDPRRTERLAAFAKRVAALRPDEEGEGASRVAISLPAVRVELSTTTLKPAAAPDDVEVLVQGIRVVSHAPPADRLPEAPADYAGPMSVRARLEAISVGMRATPQGMQDLVLPPPLLAASVLDVTLVQPADWTRSAALTAAISPLRIALSPEIVGAATAHAVAWAAHAGPARSHACAPATALASAPASSSASAATDRDRSAATVGACEVNEGAAPPPPPLNLSVTLQPSEIWLLLAPNAAESSSAIPTPLAAVGALSLAATGEPVPAAAPAAVSAVASVPPPAQAAAAERLGVCLRLGASASVVHNAPVRSTEDDDAPTPEEPPLAAACSRLSLHPRRTVIEGSLDLLGTAMAVFGPESEALAAPPSAKPAGSAELGEHVIAPTSVRASATLTEDASPAAGDNEAAVLAGKDGTTGAGLRSATASFEVMEPIGVAMSTSQLKLVAELANALAPPNPAAKRAKKVRREKGRQKLEAAVVTSAPAAADDLGSAILTRWLRTHRLSHFSFRGALVGGAHATLYGITGIAGQPMVKVCLPLVCADVQLMSDGAVAQNVIAAQASLEVLLWSRAAQAWEPLLSRASSSVQAQQVRGGIWSGCLEVAPLDFAASDAMIQRAVEANNALSLSMASPVAVDAVRPRPQQPVVYVTNQTGCAVRVRVRGMTEAMPLLSGERRSFEVSADTSAPLSESNESGSRSGGGSGGAAVDELLVEAGGIWHALPQLPVGRFGTWTFLAQPKPHSTAVNAARLSHEAAVSSTPVPLATGLSDPVAVQCVARPMADEAGGVSGAGLSVLLRSVALIHNATTSAVAAQLLVPAAGAASATDGDYFQAADTTDVAKATNSRHPTTLYATASALDIGCDKIVDLGVVAAGGSLPIPPHLASIAHLRVRPAGDEYLWPESADAFWLGSCNQNRRQVHC